MISVAFSISSILANLVSLSEMEKVEQLRRMNEYPPAAYRLANLIEARAEAIIYFKLERWLLDIFDWASIFGEGLKPLLLPVLLIGVFEGIRRLTNPTAPKGAVTEKKWRDGLSWLGLGLVLPLAAGLYFYKLESLPNSLSDDEAVVGYNAYSILMTGKDEFGKTLPIAFRFFGAYTPPLFVYLAVPMVKLLGLRVMSIRLISGVFTILAIFIVYGFIRRLRLYESRLTAVVGAFIFTTAPWVIYYARIGYEVTVGYVIFAAGAYFLWIGITKKHVSLIGLAFLSLSTYAAHAERFLVPIFLVVVSLLFAKELFRRENHRALLAGIIILVVSQAPNLYLMTTPAFWIKGEVFADGNIGRIASEFSNQLLTYFSPKALFGESADINLQHTPPAIGLFYSWLIVPFFVGIYQLYRKRDLSGGKYLWILLLTAPLPGALSGHFISIQRVMPMIIPLVLVMALGADTILSRVRPMVFLPLFALLLVLSHLLWWRSYFVFFPKERSAYWSYGYQQLAEIIKSDPSRHFVVDSARAKTVYDGLLFYLAYPPAEFMKQFSPDLTKNYYSNPKIDMTHTFGQVELRGVVWKVDPLVRQVLVGDPLTISSDQAKEHFLTKIFEIYDPSNKPVLIGYQTNPEKKMAANRKELGLGGF